MQKINSHNYYIAVAIFLFIEALFSFTTYHNMIYWQNKMDRGSSVGVIALVSFIEAFRFLVFMENVLAPSDQSLLQQRFFHLHSKISLLITQRLYFVD